MVDVIIVLMLVVAFVVALQPAHRRTWRPGLDVRNDRDRARLIGELALLETFDDPQPAPQRVRFDGECQELSPSNAPAAPGYRWFINRRSDKNRSRVAAAFATTRTASSTQRPAVGA